METGLGSSLEIAFREKSRPIFEGLSSDGLAAEV